MYEEHCLTSCDTVVSCIRLYPCAKYSVFQSVLQSYNRLQILALVLFTNCRVFGIKQTVGMLCEAVPSFMYRNELVSYISIHVPLFYDVVYTQIHCCHNMLFISLDSILVPCVVCVSVPFTELYEHALLLLWYECVLFTNKVWEFTRFIFYCSTKFRAC